MLKRPYITQHIIIGARKRAQTARRAVQGATVTKVQSSEGGYGEGLATLRSGGISRARSSGIETCPDVTPDRPSAEIGKANRRIEEYEQ